MAVRLLCKSGGKDLISCSYVLYHCRLENFNKKGCCNLLNGGTLTESSIRKMSTAGKSNEKCVTIENMNENIIRLEYAVRGPIVIRAGEIEKELQQVIIFCTFFIF